MNDSTATRFSSPDFGQQECAIQVESLWRVYETRAQKVNALRGIHLCIPSGSFIALKGRSGSGKTTLLNCLAGLDRPSSGTVKIFGQDLNQMSDAELTLWRRDQVGLVFQSFGLLPTLSAYENVELLLRLKGLPSVERHERTVSCLDLVGLKRWIDHRPYEMSGGQQQRLAIARALVNRAPLILADEPTGELDSRTAREILGLFRQAVQENQVTVLMVSHDPLVDSFADKVMQMKDGQIDNG